MSIYSGPVIDAHHHFWEPSLGRQPWLRTGARIPFRYGDYESIKRDYLPDDLRADARNYHLVGSVAMETEWELDDPVGEMNYIAAIASRSGLPSAAVAHAQLRDPSVEALLEQLADMHLVRGVREKPGQAPTAALAGSQLTLMSDPDWRVGFKLLRTYGLSFDLQVPWWHLEEAKDLAQEFDDQLIILNHAALPSDRSTAGIHSWAYSIKSISEMPNVVIKVSGIGVPGQRWTTAKNRVIVDTVAEHFGPSRMMFASNFPVDSLVGTYDEIYSGFMEMTRQWSPEEQLAAFAGNAVAYYRLSPSLMT